MTTNQNDESKSMYEAALALFQEGDWLKALSTVEKAISNLMFDDLLNRSVKAPAILPLGFFGRSLTFEQSVLLARLELLKARIQEPLQQVGAYDNAVYSAKRCKALREYADKNKQPTLEVETLRQDAWSFAARIAKLQRQQHHDGLASSSAVIDLLHGDSTCS